MSTTSPWIVILCKFIALNRDLPHFIKTIMLLLPQIYGCNSIAWDRAAHMAGVSVCVCVCEQRNGSV